MTFLKIAMMGITFWSLDISAAVLSAVFPVWWDLLVGLEAETQISVLIIWKQLLTSDNGAVLDACIYILIPDP